MKTLGLQPRDEQPFKCPERRPPEHKVINTDAADLRTVHSEFMKNSSRIQHELSRAVSTGSADIMECLNTLLKCIHGLGTSPA